MRRLVLLFVSFVSIAACSAKFEYAGDQVEQAVVLSPGGCAASILFDDVRVAAGGDPFERVIGLTMRSTADVKVDARGFRQAGETANVSVAFGGQTAAFQPAPEDWLSENVLKGVTKANGLTLKASLTASAAGGEEWLDIDSLDLIIDGCGNNDVVTDEARAQAKAKIQD